MEQTDIFEIRDGQLTAYHAKLPDVAVPEGVTCIGVGAFRDTASLRSVTLPEGVTEICSNAFNGCYNLKSVHLPDSLRYIGSHAFEYCKRLEQINMPRELLEIGEHAFEMTKVSRIRFPAKLKKIGNYAFRNLESLCSVQFPAGMHEIGCRAFANCKNLRDVSFAGSVKTIGDYAFGGCERLTEVQIAPDVPEGLFSDANAFDDTRYQEKYSRIEIDMKNQADLGVCGWTRKQDGSLWLNSRDPHDWARSNRGEIALDTGYLLIARFPKQDQPRYCISYFYEAACDRIENGFLKRKPEMYGGWHALASETEARELAADPRKAISWILNQLRLNPFFHFDAITPDLLLDHTNPAVVRAIRLSGSAQVHVIAAHKKFIIAEIIWPTAEQYCKIAPYIPAKNESDEIARVHKHGMRRAEPSSAGEVSNLREENEPKNLYLDRRGAHG